MGGNNVQKKTLRGTRSYQTETNGLLELKYYMIEQPMNEGQHYYGIEIEDSTKGKQLLLSESKAWVEELIDKFIGNGVTPSTMAYIIDDIMEVPC